MANLWDNLSEEDRRLLARTAMQGSEKSNENFNRAMKMLSQNPSMVERVAKEAGLEIGADAELDDADPDSEESQMEEENDIERNVNEAMSDDVDVQETGEVSPQGDIPPPEEGEDMDTYIQRLMMMKKKGKSRSREDLA